MECIEARALKESFLSQMNVKANSQVFYNDDVWCLTGINNGGGGEDFPVEDLLNLDFSEKDFQEGGFFKEDEEASEKGRSNNSSSTVSGLDDFDSLSTGELAVPVEDLENLEWLSQFVDDSTAELSLLCPAGSFTAKLGSYSCKRVETVHQFRAPFLLSPVRQKSRSQRPRLNRRPWSMASPPLISAGDSSLTSSSSYASSSALPPLVFMNPVYEPDWFSSVKKPPAKKQKRNPESESGLFSGRRCTHCQVQKTPQWRTGSLGPKTLCNACGVRFKSGRLFPEYRPACSPTFSLSVHSNSHREVLEMRRKKEMTIVTVEYDPVPVSDPAVETETKSIGGLDEYRPATGFGEPAFFSSC